MSERSQKVATDSFNIHLRPVSQARAIDGDHMELPTQ